jgi:ubiquinone/menaquinone biosynthesis C-methylase UbiE
MKDDQGAKGMSEIDLESVKRRQQQMWSAGDFSGVGSLLVLLSELTCEAADLRSGEKVLDVGTGAGNAAIAAARRCCDVVGIDHVPALLERARRRAEVEGLRVTFQQGDAENIPSAEASFDVVMSVIGAMFAPNQERTASELLRVCRSGGRIVMANWTPEGYVGELFRLTNRYLPPPPGVKPANVVGSEAGVRELLGPSVEIETRTREFVLRMPSSSFFFDYFATYFGPSVETLEALDDEAMGAFFIELAERFNRADDGHSRARRGVPGGHRPSALMGRRGPCRPASEPSHPACGGSRGRPLAVPPVTAAGAHAKRSRHGSGTRPC